MKTQWQNNWWNLIFNDSIARKSSFVIVQATRVAYHKCDDVTWHHMQKNWTDTSTSHFVHGWHNHQRPVAREPCWLDHSCGSWWNGFGNFCWGISIPLCVIGCRAHTDKSRSGRSAVSSSHFDWRRRSSFCLAAANIWGNPPRTQGLPPRVAATATSTSSWVRDQSFVGHTSPARNGIKLHKSELWPHARVPWDTCID